MSSVVFRIPLIDASMFDMSILAMPGIRPMVSLYPLINLSWNAGQRLTLYSSRQ